MGCSWEVISELDSAPANHAVQESSPSGGGEFDGGRGNSCVVLRGSLGAYGEEQENGNPTAIVQSLSLLLSACRSNVTTCSPWCGVPSIKYQS